MGNKHIDKRLFTQQLSHWYYEWHKLCNIIVQLDPKGTGYGKKYVTKRNEDNKWAVFIIPTRISLQ